MTRIAIIGMGYVVLALAFGERLPAADQVIGFDINEHRVAELRQGIDLLDWAELQPLDGVILAVAHTAYLRQPDAVQGLVRSGGILLDVKSALPPAAVRPDLAYWSL